jgi:hypothetical protein
MGAAVPFYRVCPLGYSQLLMMHPKVTTMLRWMGQTPAQMLMLEVCIATW